MNLTRRHKFVLNALNEADGYVMENRLPSGNGITGCVSYITMKNLRDAGFVVYGKKPQADYFGYAITDAGRAALEASHDR